MNNVLTIKEDEQSYLASGNFEHYYRMADMISKSAMVPKSYAGKAHDVLISMEMGRSLGLNPLQAVQNIAVINGKPSMYGDAMLAVCSSHPEFEDITEEQIVGGSNEVIGYICKVKRKNRSPVVHSFTIDDAKKAGLWGRNGPWASYPNRMLQMRARGFALRDSFADALGGVRVAEEVADYSKAKDITPKAELKEDLLKSLRKDNPIDAS